MRSSQRPTVLILHIGVDENPNKAHDDYFNNLSVIQQSQEVDVLQANFLEDDVEAIFAQHNICAIDTHHARLWQKNWQRYQPKLEAIQQLANQHKAKMVNDIHMFEWNADKGTYMLGMQQNGLAIIPTLVAAPDDVDDVSLSRNVMQSPNGVVIKPSLGMRASGIVFVTFDGTQFHLRQPTTPDDAKGAERVQVHERRLSAQELDGWFKSYVRDSGQDKILIQDLIKNRKEVSVVLLEGQEPYAILRTEGGHTGVAHEAFGGRNVPLPQIPPDVLRFALQARDSMPPEIALQYMHRIDILVTPDHGGAAGIMLLEVESAGPRLFIPESERYYGFANMMIATALRQERIKSADDSEPSIPAVEQSQFESDCSDLLACYEELREWSSMTDDTVLCAEGTA